MNDNHDELGRFAEASSSAEKSSRDAAAFAKANPHDLAGIAKAHEAAAAAHKDAAKAAGKDPSATSPKAEHSKQAAWHTRVANKVNAAHAEVEGIKAKITQVEARLAAM